MAIRILIADDHNMVRAVLRALVSTEPDFEVVGEAQDGHEALNLARQLAPDVVLADLAMPGPSGIEIAAELQKSLPGARVLIVSAHEDDALAREALRAGAAGYVTKRAMIAELIVAIRAVLMGKTYVRLDTPKREPAPPSTVLPSELTDHDLALLHLIARGYSDRQIAELLGPMGVKIGRPELMRKLQLSTRIDLLRYAEAHRLL